jgi:hypothetical protein
MLFDQGRRKDADTVLDDFVGRLYAATYLDAHALAVVGELYKARREHPKVLPYYLKGYRKDRVTNELLYVNLALLHEELGNDAAAIRVHQQLLAHYVANGAGNDEPAMTARDELVRLVAKRKKTKN